MKLTKILSVSAILLAGLMLTGCQKEPGSSGTSGNNPENNPTGIKAEDVIKVSNDGKTVEINYTNNTDEEQKFGPIFFDENFGSEVKGQYKLYDLDKGTPYKFGIIVDYIEFGDLNRFNVIEFNLLGIGKVNGNDYAQYNYYLSREETIKDNLLKLNFSEVNNDEHKLCETGNLEIKTGNEYNDHLSFDINHNENNGGWVSGMTGSFTLLKLYEGQPQLGYFLIIQPKSTCHLEFTLK